MGTVGNPELRETTFASRARRYPPAQFDQERRCAPGQILVGEHPKPWNNFCEIGCAPCGGCCHIAGQHQGIPYPFDAVRLFLRFGAFALHGANEPQKIFFLILDKSSKNVRWNMEGEVASHTSTPAKGHGAEKNF
jgi:hypothetical protein